MVTELVPLGDLYALLHSRAKEMEEKGLTPDSNEGVLNWPLTLRYVVDIATGMNFLHTAIPPIIHNDLKSPNILIVSETLSTTEPLAKVADFGLSSITGKGGLKGRAVENPSWLAPEVMEDKAEYTEKADVYSFGIILWELFSCNAPISGVSFSVDTSIRNENYQRRAENPR